jgi:hypothetical protein
MSARERLETYLDALRRRLRTHIYVRAGAIAAAGVLVITCVAVWLLQREQFSPAVVLSGRIALALLLLLVAALLLWLPLRWLNRDQGAQLFERHLPDEQGRIQTYLDSKRREARGIASPLTDLLAADAANIAERTEVADLVPSRRITVGSAIAATALLALALLLSVAPAPWGFSSRHLLFGADLPRDAVPVRRVVVTPGDATVRRNSDLAIRAKVEGFTAELAQVYVRFADQQQWERAPMQSAAGQAGQFEFRLYAVRGPLQYYVDAEGTRSGEHKIAVVDLPRIQNVRLTYAYPQWTGLDSKVDDSSRDIRAVAGTSVKVEVFADAPLDTPTLIVDGEAGTLSQQGRASAGSIAVEKPGHYQIGARVAGEFVALSDEYPIEIVADEKPVIEIQKPGRDWRATSIEEVPVRIQAEDDFRLREVALHYSVNGGEWRTMPVAGGAKRADSESLLRLEELGKQAGAAQRLVPGDLISYYAVAKDRKQAVQTDLFMVQVQPFERRFTQAQNNGGGGGMGEEQGAISERQREILLATWNLQRNDERNARSRQQLEDSAKMLAELQTTLATQARTLAERMRARTSADQDERVKTFVESLEQAVHVMEPAAQYLSAFKLQAAVPVEQQALQQLLRAEAAFREVQVSMQQNDSQGSGSQSARNFTEMFELEMDLEKNQYENESQLSMQSAQKDLDEAIRKLKELAQRQERLAQERNDQLRAQEQRWKQEQLRREAEDLRRRLAQMSRQQQQSPSQNANARGAQRGSEGNRSQQSGSQQQSDPQQQSGGQQRSDRQVAQALESVNRALEDMRSANEGAEADQEQATQSARNASRNLRQALRQIDRPKTSTLDDTLEEFAERTQRLAAEQRRVENELHDALSEASHSPARTGSRGSIDQQRAQQLVESKQQMANDLAALQRDMRNAVHEHRTQTPETARRLGEIVRNVEDSDVMYRLNRSAAEIYYGRARDAAPREGLITDALDMLEQDLREAATLASKEKTATPDQATPEELLAEVSELRRALQEASRSDGQAGTDATTNARSNSERERGAQKDRASSGQRADQAEGASAGLAAWNPVVPNARFSALENGRGSLTQQTADISQRVRDLANRMRRGELSQAELELLRRTANQLRRLSGDPVTAQTQAMLQLVDQIELTALAASARARDSASARATLPDPESPRYREAVAEYYRRLGNR